MGKFVAYIAICGMLFAAGLGLAFALDIPGQRDADSDAESQDTLKPDISDVVPGNPEADLVQLESDDEAEAGDATQLPVAIRGKPLSAEELFRFGAMYREQQDALTKRSKQIETRSARLKLIHDDLAGSRKEFDGFRAQVRDMTRLAEQTLLRVQQERQRVEQQESLIESDPSQGASTSQKASPAAESLNMKKIASWLESMPADKAAQYLRELSNEGKVDSAVELLAKIEERNVAKILAALDNPTLVVELTEAFRTAKRTDASGPRRTRR